MARLRGHDLPLAAAGLTFYGLIGGPPLLLLATRLVAALQGQERTHRLLLQAEQLVPSEARGPLSFLAAHGTTLPWAWAAAAAVPAGLYGEGLVRAFGRLCPSPTRRRSLRGRVVAAGAAFVVPLALLVALGAVDVIGRHGLLLGTYLAFLVAWVLATLALAIAYRCIAPSSPRAGPVLWSAAATGSVLAGFGLGFLLFLALPVDVGPAYGGDSQLATAAIAALWAYGLHAAVLGGYAVTLGLEEAKPDV